MIYYIDGLGGPIVTAGADETLGSIWNPSSTRRIVVLQAALLMRDFDIPPNSLYVCRTSARGVAASTVTPDADNAEDGVSAPASGFLVDMAEFSTQPTLLLPACYGPFTFPTGVTGAEGSGFALPLPNGIVIAPGQGMAIVERQASSFGGNWDVNFVVSD